MLALAVYQRAIGSEESPPVVKGYWRAPSIQASLYDDSAHSVDGMVSLASEIEMEKSTSSPVVITNVQI
jgi:hypothetical protein